jgi:hypothetical protein
MCGECKQHRIEADRISCALQHGTLEVVIEQHPGHPAKSDKRLGMAAQEGRHLGIQEEAQEDAARIAQHHHEGHQRTPGAADLQVAEVSPLRRVSGHAECSPNGPYSRALAMENVDGR